MGFYQQITNEFGINTTMLMKKWSILNNKLANCLNRKNFLLRCRRTGIFPRHIQDGTKTMIGMMATNNWRIAEEMRRHIHRLSKKNLNIEIKVCYHNISKINSSIVNIQNQLKNIIPLFMFNEYTRRVKVTFEVRFNRVKNLNLTKFDKLKHLTKNDQELFKDNRKWFCNISDIDIPKDVADFLSLGPKFGVSPTGLDLNIKTFLADVEDIIVDIPDENHRNILRAQVANQITNFQVHSNSIKLTPTQRSFLKTKKFLKMNPDLYILQADKGGCTVAINKTDYVSKTNELLNDPNTYKLIKQDPRARLQRTLNELIKSLKNRSELNDEVAKHLTVYNSVLAKLYCLPKIHKTNVPLRPIVSCIGSATYNLSKFVSVILTDALANRTDYNVKDTFFFVNSIQGARLPENYVLVSLDVVSLFTNIPFDLIVQLLELHWEKIEPYTTLTFNGFFKLFSFIFDNCYFSFNNCFYQQIFGTPMGSPISPILAQIVMDHLLDLILPRLAFPIPFIFKFVDDMVTAVPDDQMHNTLNIFNSINEHLQFTLESETNKSVPFLDTLVTRAEDNRIVLDWYQKPTASGRFINYFSNHPTNQKFNTIIAMKNRITHISDERFLVKNLKILFDIFLNNGYHASTLKKLIYSTSFYDGPIDRGNTLDIKYKKLPYVQGLTENIVGCLRSSEGFTISKYNTLTVGKIFTKTKDKTPLLDNCNVVYKIPCKQCEKCYIGQTKQNLKQRITQHKSDSRIGKKSCALADHFQRMDHMFDYDNTTILEIQTHQRKRLFLEMVHINNEKEAINSRSDIDQLSIIYCNILK